MNQPNVCPTPKIGNWLQSTHSSIELGSKPAWIILGNESADLDSAISSLIFAYCLATITSQLIIPLLPIPRVDFPLRTEIVRFFSLLGLDPLKLLYFREDLVNLAPNGNGNMPNIGLVDFNELTPSLNYLSQHVKAVIDHHLPDKGKFMNASPRVVQVAGSAASLVTLQYQDVINNLPVGIRKELGTLALGPILIDTVNLNMQQGRTTSDDIRAVELCQKWIGAAKRGTVDTTALYNDLSQAKANLGNLNGNELLRKDYKEYSIEGGSYSNQKYGISSIMWDLKKWSKRDTTAGVVTESNKYANDKGLSLLFLHTAIPDQVTGGFTRQLAVVGRPELTASIMKQLETERDIQLVRDQAVDTPDPSIIPVYNIASSMSRKVIQPLIHKVLARL